MKKRILAICLISVLLLAGCSNGAGIGGGSDTSSEMAQLTEDATTEEMVRAFEADYNRAAEQAGIDTSYNGLDFEENDGMATIYLESGLMLMIDPPSTFHRIWYAGYPESSEWMEQEAALVLMAGDDTLAHSEAEKLITEIFDAGWENRDNMPSAVQDDSPGGVHYSYSINDRGLVSFAVNF